MIYGNVKPNNGAFIMPTLLLDLAIFVACKTQWISPSNPSLPRADRDMAIGSYNDSIYLLGGYTAFTSSQLIEYDISRNLFIDYDADKLPIGIFGYASYYTQMDHLLYFIDHGDALSSYDLQTKSLSFQFASIPTNVGDYGCLASNTRYLFVIGGAFNQDLDIVQVLTISNNQWLDSVPSMQQQRLGHSCIIDPSTDILYAIGGFTFDKFNRAYTDTIEKIDTNSIQLNSWSYIQSLSNPAAYSRSVLYNNMIYIIGGANGPSLPLNVLDMVHIIDLMTDIVSVSVERLVYPVIDSSVIIVDDILYVFGGYNEDNFELDTWMVYTFIINHTSYSPTSFNANTQMTQSQPTQHPTLTRSSTTNSRKVTTARASVIPTNASSHSMQDLSTLPSEHNSIITSVPSLSETLKTSEVITTININETNDNTVYALVISAIIIMILFTFVLVRYCNGCKKKELVETIEMTQVQDIDIASGVMIVYDTKQQIQELNESAIDKMEGLEVTVEGEYVDKQSGSNNVDVGSSFDTAADTKNVEGNENVDVEQTQGRLTDWVPTNHADA